jgi:hypothetical protein
MGANCLMKTCLLLQELSQNGTVRHATLLDEYVRAGILERKGNTITVKDQVSLKKMIEGQCAGLLNDKSEAEVLLQEMGLDIAVTSLPREALLLAKALKRKTTFPERAWHQQLSAELFGDSKFLQKHSLLFRIYAQWRAKEGGSRELRIKAFEAVKHELGLDLLQITQSCGQAVLDGTHASDLTKWDFSGLELVVTCENLSPFLQLDLTRGLLVYTAGYAGTSLIDLLRGLPIDCRWVHFGDFDPDGLFIFENIQKSAERTGRFFPSVSFLNENDLPGYLAKRKWEPSRFCTNNVKELACLGATKNLYVEQESIMAASANIGLIISDICL